MRIVLCGYYGMRNGGDEALLTILLNVLPAEARPIVLSCDPRETARRYGVKAVHRESFGPVIRALRQADVFILGGGGLLQDATSPQNPVYYGGLMLIARWLGLRTIAWGQGIGPLKHFPGQVTGRHALRHCEMISVRDSGSEKWLKQWGISCVQAPDPVWALNSLPVEGLPDLPGPRVAVALRPHPWLTEARLEQFSRALALFQAETETCILLVPFHLNQDMPIAQFLQRRLPGPNHVCCLSNPRRLKGLFQEVDLTIGMRFHSLVMAASEGCRCFAISYAPKVSRLMADLDLPGFDLDPRERSVTAAHGWPGDARRMAQAWVQTYVSGDSPTSRQIKSRIDRAMIHQDLLREALEPRYANSRCHSS